MVARGLDAVNRANRRRHRRIFQVLILTLPIALGAALSMRAADPVMDALPAPLRDAAPPRPADGEIIWTNLPLRMEVWRADAKVRLRATAPLRVADPLLYWAAEAPTTPALPGEARLLGPLSDAAPQTFSLPAPGGVLLLSSPLSGAVLGVAALSEAR